MKIKTEKPDYTGCNPEIAAALQAGVHPVCILTPCITSRVVAYINYCYLSSGGLFYASAEPIPIEKKSSITVDIDIPNLAEFKELVEQVKKLTKLLQPDIRNFGEIPGYLYLAKDRDGEVYLYGDMPECGAMSWPSEDYKRQPHLDSVFQDIPWRESLHKYIGDGQWQRVQQ